MKRYLTIAKQVAKERIGTKDESVNTDEVESEREHFVTLKEGYTKVHSNAKSLYNDHWPSFLTHNDNLIAQLLSFSESLKGSNYSSTSTTTIAESLDCVGNGLLRENKIASYCIQSDKSGFLDTTNKICDIFIKDVNELRMKQELSRLQLSSTLGQLKTLQKKASEKSSKDTVAVTTKLQQAEEENRQAQEEYDNATSLFMEGMDRLETAGRNDFFSSLTSLAEAHLRSMEDGVAMWKDVLAKLEKLEERDPTPPVTPGSASGSPSSAFPRASSSPNPASASPNPNSAFPRTASLAPPLPRKNSFTPKLAPRTPPPSSPSFTPDAANPLLDYNAINTNLAPVEQKNSNPLALSGVNSLLRRLSSSPKPVLPDSPRIAQANASQSTTNQPTTNQPTTNQSTTDHSQSTTDQSTTNQFTADQPLTNHFTSQPVSDQPNASLFEDFNNSVFEPTTPISEGIKGLEKNEQEEYEELAL